MAFKATYGNDSDVYADFDIGSVTLALFDHPEMSKVLATAHLPLAAAAQDHVCLVFAVDEVAVACQQLIKQGISLTAEPSDHPDWGIHSGYLRGPDGNLIELYHPLAPNP
jgi:catechol 2,3-dioxygenase-like lactoylglutathione lyase family enzyme